MSMLEPEDIAKWEEQKMKSNQWKVEEIEAVSFDENGQEDGTWNGYSVTKIDDPANYCFDCRDKLNADQLCEFLNREMVNPDDSIDAFVIDNCIEWGNLINELSKKEEELLKLKDIIFDKEEWIIENTDFKELYGRNNEKIRQLHFSKYMRKEYDNRRGLQLSIDYIQRRIKYLEALVPVKTALLNAEGKK